MKLNKNHKILIVGLGLIGGSYALALKDKGYEVCAISLNQDDIDYALENNIINHGFNYVDKEYVKSFDVVIFALYPNVFIDWISNYHNYFKKGTIISDVTGVKGVVVDKIQNILGDDVEFVPAHPMAGREVYGVKNASKDLFKGANLIITPTEKNTLSGIELIHNVGEELEFSNIVNLSVDEHDEMIAFLSQLTHCIAISLMTCKESEHLKEYTGDSFRDLTRIASINENMWTELFLLNKDELLSQMDLFINEFIKLKEYISQENEEKIKEMMKLSTYRRSFFNKK